jgi:hypothetical protein
MAEVPGGESSRSSLVQDVSALEVADETKAKANVSGSIYMEVVD